MPTAELPPVQPIPPVELAEAGVRGNVRGTQADTAEMQRRGIITPMQESLVDLNDPVPRTGVFTIESQGINREAIAPDTRGMQGEIVREGPLVTPRTQLPSTERLALPSEAEVAPIEATTASKPTIPRPMGGKAGEAGFITSEAFDAPAKIAKNYLSSQGALTPEMADELLANKYNKSGSESGQLCIRQGQL